ncbi:amino acid adenylation domain-containing protein [Nocardiopsis alba]|uniref:non-ribosomal peptide synthetase n=1 Tax=Nocardiopsis alba TaxID=53437 RepID=UPI0036502F1E
MTAPTISVLTELAEQGVRITVEGDALVVSAPQGGLTPRIRSSITENREEILSFLRAQEDERERRDVRIRPADRKAPIPASYAQRRLWLVEQLGSDVPIYNMYFLSRFSGRLDVDALRGAVSDLVERHEVMRTGLTEVDGELYQRIESRVPLPFTLHEVTSDSLERVKSDIAATRFDLASAPLIRFDLLHWGKREWLLMVTQHHVISDGWSTSLIRKELTELYGARTEGRRPDLRPIEVHYADYAVWEREWLGGELARRQRDFWRTTLKDLPPLLDLAPARRRPAVQSYRGDLLPFELSEETLAQARGLATACNTTLYGVLIAAYSLLLSRISRSDDIAVGSPLASRPYPALEDTIGLFFNSITIRSRPDGEQTVRGYLGRVRKTVLEAFAHQDLPFDRVVHEVAPERNTSHSPVFQSVFILQSYPDEPLSLPGTEPQETDLPAYSAQYDVMFKLREVPEGFTGQLFYNDSLFSRSDAALFVDWFRTTVAVMSRRLDSPLKELSLTGDEDERRVREWNDRTFRSLPAVPVHETITRRLRGAPDRPAVSFRGGGLTRGGLDAAAAGVAAALRAQGLRPGQRVGVMVPRSPELVAVLLGVMRAGLVYVPLNGTTPVARLDRMLTVAECAALVVDGPYTGTCPEFSGRRLHASDLIQEGDPSVEFEGGRGDEAAYVIFTSGSTGDPKGVEVSQANLVNLFAALDEAVASQETETWLAVTDITFDIAVVELLWTLARGIPIVLAETAESMLATGDSEEVGAMASVPELIGAHGVTAMQATPTLVRSLLRLPGAERALGDLDLLMLGGEPLDIELVTELHGLGLRRLLNMYGPTETTVWSTYWEVPREPERILVGGPLANTTIHILDASLQPVPVGMYGELCIGGAGVALGYVGDPRQTEERFVRLEEVDGLVYRTGDIARLLSDGTIELVGRLDNQVKVQGYRIELEEVERALNTVPGVVAAAVKVQRAPEGDRLAAFYVSDDARELDVALLRAELEKALPRQMIPERFRRVDLLPTTTGGKVDRRALPDEEVDHRDDREPRGNGATAECDLEERLLVLWRRVLGNERISVVDDFFRSGGNSILVARLLTEIREHVAPDTRIVDLFRFPNVRAFAGHLARPKAEAVRETEANGRPNKARRERRLQVQRKRRAQAARGDRRSEEDR